jgi:hypothetical protein
MDSACTTGRRCWATTLPAPWRRECVLVCAGTHAQVLGLARRSCARRAAHAPRIARLNAHDPPLSLRSEADRWLNDPDVRAALHAAPLDVTGAWQLCSDRIDYTSDGGSMLPVHSFLLKAGGCACVGGLRMWMRSAGALFCPYSTGQPPVARSPAYTCTAQTYTHTHTQACAR